jgi:NAD(P)H dehydrogenase (quinone)
MRVAIVHHSGAGMADAVAEGAVQAGGEVRVRDVTNATQEDVDWADVALSGSPGRFGDITPELKLFLGRLPQSDKVYGGFVVAGPAGGESTLLALYASLHHLGGVLVAPGYTDDMLFHAGTPQDLGYRATATAGRLAKAVI